MPPKIELPKSLAELGLCGNTDGFGIAQGEFISSNGKGDAN